LKKVILVLILLTGIILIISCTKKEIIKLDSSDITVSMTQLLDKNIEIDYEKAVVNPIIFTNKDDYERFAKQYFKAIGEKDFDYEKYDLLLVNGKKINPQGDTLYSVNSIIKRRNSVEVTLKINEQFKSNEFSKDIIIQNIIYVRLSKGTIIPKSDFKITK